MSTLNAARELGLTDLGAIAPGYHADFQLVSSLDGVCPSKVFINGKLVAENGNYIQNDLSDFTYNPSNTIQTSWISDKSSFSMIIDMNVKNIDVNVMVPLDETNILRTLEVQTLPVHNKKISLNTRKDLAFVSVINRHGLENMCVSIIQNYGLKDGAFGTTISHDSHNVVIIYKTEEDALCVLRKLEEMGGGMCASKNGQIIGALALPFAGLMSEKSCAEVAEEFEQYTESFYTICDKTTPIMSASIMSLTALPGVVITDCGLVNGDTQKILA
jgi:adenine deaminase